MEQASKQASEYESIEDLINHYI